MSFFAGLPNKKKKESVVLIDIGTGSVAGAHALYTEDETPLLLYTRRLPITTRKDEPHEEAMLRAFRILGEDMIREGASVLMRTTGSGSVDTVLVSVDAPWQETYVRTEYFEQKTPFIFSKRMVRDALAKTNATTPSEKPLADESIIGTILNGYETRNPYGKEAHRASVIILSSFVDERISQGIRSIVQGLYHIKNILIIAGSSLRYQSLRIAFPHERNALILDATGPLTSVSLIRNDLLVEVSEISTNKIIGVGAWLKALIAELATLAQRFPLPRTIFLLAREIDRTSLQATLDEAELGKLWLSDNPPQIISVLPSHMNANVRQTSTTTSDIALLLMALYYAHRSPE